MRRGFVGDLDAGDPAFAERVAAEGFEVVGQLVVGGDHFAGDGGVDVAHGLYGFDFAERFSGLHLAADFGQLDEDEVGERFDGKRADADSRSFLATFVSDGDPFVRFGEE